MLCPTWLSVALLSVAEPVSSNMSARRQNPPTRPPTIGSSWPTAVLKSECIVCTTMCSESGSRLQDAYRPWLRRGSGTKLFSIEGARVNLR